LRFAVKKLNPGKNRKIVALVKGKPSRPAPDSSYTTTMKALEILFENDRSFENSIYEIYRKTVMIKPSLPRPLEGLEPSNMLNTDPQACRAVVDWLIEKEAKRIIFAEANIWGKVDPWHACGYREVFSPPPYRDMVDFVDLGTGEEKDLIEIDYEMPRDFYTQQDLAFLKGFLEGRVARKRPGSQAVDFEEATSTSAKFNKVLKEASVLINMAKMKTHVQTGVSLTVQNHFAFLEPPRSRFAKHLGMDPLQRNLTYTELILSSLNVQRSMACVAAAYKSLRIPQLCIVEGIISQEGNGPLEAGKARQENLVAAAWNSPATLDTVLSQRFMGLGWEFSYLPPHIQWASRLGLGTRDASEISLVLAREDGIPASSIEEMRTNPLEPFDPPVTLKSGCAPRVFPRDTLLPVMTRALEELQAAGVDPNKPLPVVRRKIKALEGTVSL